MAIKYVSKDDRPEDPGGLIKQALDMGPEFPGPAEDILMAWMLRLPEDADAAEAARRLIADYGIAEGPVPDDPRGKLIDLLRQTTAASRDHLSPRRRGRRR